MPSERWRRIVRLSASDGRLRRVSIHGRASAAPTLMNLMTNLENRNNSAILRTSWPRWSDQSWSNILLYLSDRWRIGGQFDKHSAESVASNGAVGQGFNQEIAGLRTLDLEG